MYKSWTPFSTKEIKQFVGLYVLDGISPSPRFEMKFNTQLEDPANGNDLCHDAFGSNAGKRFKMFKCFFAVQDPRLENKPKKTHPNFKVDPFMLHLLQ